MNCPRCQSAVPPQQPACEVCGFSATFLHHHLGNQWVRLDRVTDAAHCLRLEELRSVEIVLDDFERRFPQAFFAIYLGILPANLSAGELGFWLLNQGAFNTHSIGRRNDFGMVFVVDPSAKIASLSLGYAVEACFTAGQIKKLLNKAAKALPRGAFGLAIETACHECSRVLRRHARRTNWRPETSLESALTQGMNFQPLREGAKASSRPIAGFHAH